MLSQAHLRVTCCKRGGVLTPQVRPRLLAVAGLYGGRRGCRAPLDVVMSACLLSSGDTRTRLASRACVHLRKGCAYTPSDVVGGKAGGKLRYSGN